MSSTLEALFTPARRLGTFVLLAGGVTAVICVWTSLSLQTARSIPVTQAPKPVAEDRLEKSKAAYDKMLATATETVITRAPFGQIKVVTKVKDPAKPLVPSSYGGPELTGIADNFAWFRDGKRIKLGEEAGGLKILALDPPWSAQIRWAGGEYKVKLFDRSIANLTQNMGVWLGAPPPPPPPSPVIPAPTPAASSGPARPVPPGGPPSGPNGLAPGVAPSGGLALPGSGPATPVPGGAAPGATAPGAVAPGAPAQWTVAPASAAPTLGKPPEVVPPVPVPVPEPAPEPEPDPERSGHKLSTSPK